MPAAAGTMKCLTICQPYAEEIMRQAKRVENRTWWTNYRGPLLIHAGKSRAWLCGETDDELKQEYGRKLEFGAIVGQVNLVDCVKATTIQEGRLEARYPGLMSDAHQHHVNGPWCFVLDNVRRFPSAIPYRGAQGFFNVPKTALAEASACS